MGGASRPSIAVRAPTSQALDEDAGGSQVAAGPSSSSQASNVRKRPRQSLFEPDIYLGSYANPRKIDVSPHASEDSRAPRGKPTPRTSTSQMQLEHLLQCVDVKLDPYGVEELRDGFFDASFFRPLQRDRSEVLKSASETFPSLFQDSSPFPWRQFLSQQWQEAVEFVKQTTTSRSGVRLSKSFLGFFIAYVICLVPVSRIWLGRRSYIMAISAIVNHAGRPVGSQIDGALLTTFGTVMGLGWGSLALFVSTSTMTAKSGYGGLIASFLICFTAGIAWLRCVFMRFYQAVLCAGIAICYTCLSDTSQSVGWRKVFDYGIPWVLGQALCLIISIVLYPDTGSPSVSYAFHSSLRIIKDGLILPRQENPTLRRDLAWNLVNLSQAVRDFTIDISISRFHPNDVRSLRNLLQGVLRGVMAIRPGTNLFESISVTSETRSKDHHTAINLDPPAQNEHPMHQASGSLQIITQTLAEPTRRLIDAMVGSVDWVDRAIMNIGGFGGSLNLSSRDPDDLSQRLEHLRTTMNEFDSADASLINHPALPHTYSGRPEIVEVFLFVHPIRQAAEKVEAVVVKALEMQQEKPKWKINLPSYPWSKSLLRSNAQVRHDRGGLTAGFYFRSKSQLERTMRDLRSNVYVPRPQSREAESASDIINRQMPVIGRYEEEKKIALKGSKVSDGVRLRYEFWKMLHRLQGFESRFAFKVTLITTLISIPAWLPQSRSWWNSNESWWAVVTVWTMMHPRVSGTFQDLAVRASCAILGAIWGGLAFAADDGNPYVMAVFAVLFMIPMLYRFTQSSHPRSGIIGCMSFTVISLSAYTSNGEPCIVKITWTRGLAFVVGVVAAVIVNWILWPFVARHELRKSLSAMVLHSSLLYRAVVAKYIYYTEGKEPGPEDIAKSEMLEGRLREGFVRMRQLMELTQHEIRLRAPFNPFPYSALIDSCERFFEHLVQVRQSSLYFRPTMLPLHPSSSTTIDPLLQPRRDAVAVILMNLYVLATALRANRPLPHHLPSAAAARQNLLECMERVEDRDAGEHVDGERPGGRRWADVYRYAYSAALTDIVEEVQTLQRFTKEVTGERGFNAEAGS